MASSQPPNSCNSEVPISMPTSMATGGAMGFHPSVAEGCAETPSKHLSQSVPVHQTPGTSARVQHLSCLPQSACSPLLHTPGGATGSTSRVTLSCSKYKTPGSGHSNRFTPRFHTTPGGTSKQIISNPFETHLMDKLNSDSPMFSPNMFKLTEPGSAEKTPKSFRWSIDQIAILKPAEIDEMPIQQDTLNLVDKVAEVKAQKAIEKFFEKGNIVPSPWTEPVKFELPRTPVVESCKQQQTTPDAMETSSREAACQTLITLPKEFDLQKLLGDQHVYNGVQSVTMDTGDNSTDMSTSSLRRKLFFHGDEGLSPVRGNKSRLTEVMDMTSPMVSPVKCGQTPVCQGKLSPIHTPNSGQFSSSPIHGRDSLMTPSMRRCSTAPALMDSPNFSPIGTTEGKGVEQTPAQCRLQATPSSGAPAQDFSTPDMSPITMGEGGGHGNSYMESPDTGKVYSKSDSLRRRALRGCSGKPPIPRELQMSPVANPFSLGLTKPSETDINDNSHHVMDMSCEILESDIQNKTKDNVASRPEFTEFREYSDFDGDNTTGFHVNSHSSNTQSQDTGYQTYSVNQETGLTTTQNLSVNQEELEIASTLDTGPTNITGHFSALTSNLGIVSDTGHFRSRTAFKPKVTSRVHFDIEEDREAEVNNKTLPFSNYRDTFNSSVKSTDDIIAEKPSQLIFSDLENLANKFSNTASSSGSTTFSFSIDRNAGHTFSQGSIRTVSKSICKSFSTGNMGNIHDIQSSTFSERGLPETDAKQGHQSGGIPEYRVAEHMRKYTQGSMIKHEQVYEPPIYVMTSQGTTQSQCTSQPQHLKNPASHSCNSVHMDIKNTESEGLCGSDPLRTFASQFSQNRNTQESSKTTVTQEQHHHNAPGLLHRSKSAVSAILPPPKQLRHPQRQLSLQLGRPAYSNPAFTIETLTPKNVEQPKFSGLFPLSKESHSLGVAPLQTGSASFSQRLLFPDQHPASPVAEEEAVEHARWMKGGEVKTAESLVQNRLTAEEACSVDSLSPAFDGDQVSLQHPWYTMASCTPKRQSLQRLVRGMERRKQDVANMMPSEVAIQVLRKAEQDLEKLKNGEALDPSFLDNTSFQDSCIVEDIACGGNGGS